MNTGRHRVTAAMTPLIGVVVFCVALAILHHALAKYTYHDIAVALTGIPQRGLVLAGALAALSYLTMTLYDYLGFRYVDHRLPYFKIAFASFIGFAFSNTVGYSVLSGGSIRYRLYSGWAVTSGEIARIILFCTTCSILGMSTLGSVAILLEPRELIATLNLPFIVLRPLGLVLILGVCAYFLLCVFRKKPITVGPWELTPPSGNIAGLQILAAAIDYSLAAAVLYVLLPTDHHLSFAAFLGMFILAVLCGVLSQVPGGLGVFETLMLLLLAPYLPPAPVLGALLAYRIIYYLVPLGLGAVLIATYEVRQRKTLLQRASSAFGTWASPLVPDLLASLAFVCGAILLFSSVTPATHARMAVLRTFLPLPVIEASHFLASLAGIGLLLLGRGLQRRVDAAFVLTTLLLAGGCVLSLLKGFDYEEATILVVTLAVLLPCRRHFYRRASLVAQPFTAQWIGAISIVLICSAWLALFSFKHVEYGNELWWQFSFHGDAPRTLRAEVGVTVILLGVTLARLLTPAVPNPQLPDPKSVAAAAHIVRQSPNTVSNLALLGDKSLLFNEDRTAFIMYGSSGRSWVAMGNPVGPPDAWVDLIWQFKEVCDRHGAWPVFYQVPAQSLHYYLDLGMLPHKLGEEARVNLANFSLEGSSRKAERNTLNRLDREGYRFELIQASEVPSVLYELRDVSDEWLAEKNTREKRFSLGCFQDDYIRQFPHAVVRKEEAIIAFANVWESAGKEDLSIDLMRYRREAPNGIMDYLFLHLLLWGKEHGYRWFTLGMAPLSGFEERAQATMWNRLAALVYRHGEHFYNFQGLRQYKEKFQPIWTPKYLVSPAGIALPHIVANVTALISGGLTGAIKK